MDRRIKTLDDLDEESVRFVKSLNIKKNKAIFITLSGELGAGKTAFVKAAARALGVDKTVNSPTFVLEKIYSLDSARDKNTKAFSRLVHIDAYRLESGKDLSALGFDEMLQESGNLIFLEWPERVADVLPAPDVKITLVVHSDESRVISYG